LVASDISFGCVKVVVTCLVRNEILGVDRSTEPFEGIIETVQSLEVGKARSASYRREGKAVQLLILRGRVPCKLDANVAQLAAVIGVVGAPGIIHLRIGRPGASPLENRRIGAVHDAVSHDDETTPVSSLPPGRALGCEDDWILSRS
jgi:hypothetical protein